MRSKQPTASWRVPFRFSPEPLPCYATSTEMRTQTDFQGSMAAHGGKSDDHRQWRRPGWDPLERIPGAFLFSGAIKACFFCEGRSVRRVRRGLAVQACHAANSLA